MALDIPTGLTGDIREMAEEYNEDAYGVKDATPDENTGGSDSSDSSTSSDTTDTTGTDVAGGLLGAGTGGSLIDDAQRSTDSTDSSDSSGDLPARGRDTETGGRDNDSPTHTTDTSDSTLPSDEDTGPNAGGTGSFGDRGDTDEETDPNAGGTGSFGDREDSYMEDSDSDNNQSDDNMSDHGEPPEEGMVYSERYGWYDPDKVESGSPGSGGLAVDTISPDPNENSDGDAVTVNDDGTVNIDPSDTDQDVPEQIAEVQEFSEGSGGSDGGGGSGGSDDGLVPEITLETTPDPGQGGQASASIGTPVLLGGLGLAAAFVAVRGGGD